MWRSAGALACALASACAASRAGPTLPRAAADSLGASFNRLADSSRSPAVSLAVMHRGKVVYTAARGYADIASRRVATSHTMYRVGSVSKLFTAAAAMRLAERGALSWDAEIRHYVPEFPVKAHPITLRQLAGHLAGIRHYAPSEFLNRAHFDSVAATLAVFRGDSLLAAPGTRYLYSSYGFTLLSLAVERAAREPFLATLRREVIVPLGLTETAADHADSAIGSRATGYEVDAGGSATRSPAMDLSDRWGSGGLLASVLDLARFGSAFLAPGFLSAESVAAMTTPQSLAGGAPTSVGLAWRVGRDARGRAIWHHAGTALGGRAVLVVWPDEGIVVAVAGNSTFNLSERHATAFADLVQQSATVRVSQ